MMCGGMLSSQGCPRAQLHHNRLHKTIPPQSTPQGLVRRHPGMTRAVPKGVELDGPSPNALRLFVERHT